MLAGRFDEYRDNLRNSQSVFLVMYASNEENRMSTGRLDKICAIDRGG